MTVPEELRAAAAKLRKKARPLLDANADKDWAWGDFFTLHGADFGLIREDEEWVACMSPLLAEPLARWLELCAAGCEVEAADLPGTVQALTVARVINGTAK